MSCCNELDARLTTLVCFTTSFAQSMVGVMFVPFPYLLVACLGIFLSLYFVLNSRQATADTAGYYLWFFMAQQVCAMWGLYYWIEVNYDIVGICLNAFFCFAGIVGSIASHRLEIILRGSQVFAPVAAPASA